MKPLLSLVMMVKNEAKNIRAVLETVRPFVDRYTILDTGSTDGTQAIVAEVMGGTLGSLIEEPFQGYAETRNRVLDLDAERRYFSDAGAAASQPECEFQLMLSGDEYLVGGAELRRHLEAFGSKADCHALRVEIEKKLPWQGRITKTGSAWRYADDDCGIDEVPTWKGEGPGVVFPFLGARIEHRESDPQKRMETVRDVHIPLLEAALERNPENARALELLAEKHIYLANWSEPAEGDKDHEIELAAEYLRIRMLLPFENQDQQKFLAYRWLHCEMLIKRRPMEQLLNSARELLKHDPERPETALLVAQIAAKVDGLRVGDVYRAAHHAAQVGKNFRMRGYINSAAPTDLTCEWRAHQLAAIAADQLGDSVPEAKEIARQHAEEAIKADGPRFLFRKFLPDGDKKPTAEQPSAT